MTGSVVAQMPTFATFSGSGTTAATVIIPQRPTSQVRVVSVIASSDLASSTIDLYSGTTARYVVATNLSTSATTMVLDSTNGLASNAVIYVQSAISNTVATITAVTATNIWAGTGTITNVGAIVTLSGALGVLQAVNAEVEVLGNHVALGLGASSYKQYGSDGLYVGNYGRAVYITTTATNACAFNAVTVHFDSQSN